MHGFPLGRASLAPSRADAEAMWRHVVDLLEDEREQVAEREVSAPVGDRDLKALRDAIGAYDFGRPAPAEGVVEDVARMLRAATVHTTHPRYFGLFNPTPALMGVVGETLAAAFNPQLAAWSHAPAAVEIEAHLLRFLGGRLGYPPAAVAGSFTSGGAEANMTAVLLALTRTWPRYGEEGLRALPGRPVMYASAESHLAWLKIAHAAGLGRDAVRLVPVGPDLRMDTGALADRVAADRADGDLPFLVVATAGTTAAGVVDPLHDLADLCRDLGLRLHADAAYGGAAALSDRLRPAWRGSSAPTRSRWTRTSG